ncbi:MAG: N-6 DNA methylase [Candidatus Aenigmarchaeota archaeon]|nr:N-6 DNA methylase [Candidatus Aenigmarchaeota archaeon]
MNKSNGDLEKKLWSAADSLRANSNLKSHEYSVPVLGLIFLRFVDGKFSAVEKELKERYKGSRSGDKLTPTHFQAEGVMYLPEEARYSYLLNLPESENIGHALNEAMKLIEKYNKNLEGVLPKTYAKLENDILFTLLKTFSGIPIDEGDVFGKIYEYFLGHFAMTEGQKGGEFFTPTSIVKLIVEIIEPYHGRIFDPACGSGGMFVQSANLIREHKKNPGKEITAYGQEKVDETMRLCKMNLAVHGLEGQIKLGNTFYQDLHNSINKFDFVMANPPFNVKGVDKEKIKDDPRYNLGISNANNANYLWIQIFLSALNENGRAGFVMANSASDAGNQEKEIRKKMIDEGYVDVMVSVSSNFFYTVTLPVTLWFLDKGKVSTDCKNKILFIDARNIYNQIDRAHRDWTSEQIQQIADIVRNYRGEPSSANASAGREGAKPYEDVKGLCKVATIEEVAGQGYSLNAGRYVGVADKEEEEYDYKERLEEYHKDLMDLNKESDELMDRIDKNLTELIK